MSGKVWKEIFRVLKLVGGNSFQECQVSKNIHGLHSWIWLKQEINKRNRYFYSDKNSEMCIVLLCIESNSTVICQGLRIKIPHVFEHLSYLMVLFWEVIEEVRYWGVCWGGGLSLRLHSFFLLPVPKFLLCQDKMWATICLTYLPPQNHASSCVPCHERPYHFKLWTN